MIKIKDLRLRDYPGWRTHESDCNLQILNRFSKRYAEWMCDALLCETADYRNIGRLSLDDFDLMIYGGSLHSGKIDGVEKIKALLQNRKCDLIVFATGATPNAVTQEIDRIMRRNFSDNAVAHFYMQSGLCHEKMGLADKTIMKMPSKMLLNKEGKSDTETGTAAAISTSHDIADRIYTKPFIDFINEKYGGT